MNYLFKYGNLTSSENQIIHNFSLPKHSLSGSDMDTTKAVDLSSILIASTVMLSLFLNIRWMLKHESQNIPVCKIRPLLAECSYPFREMSL